MTDSTTILNTLLNNNETLVNLIKDERNISMTTRQWYQNLAYRVYLDESNPDRDFLKIKETLTRMGISAPPKDDEEKPRLYQSCHILQKKGEFYIVHFKELLMLDGKRVNLNEDDLRRKYFIIWLLYQWELIALTESQFQLLKTFVSYFNEDSLCCSLKVIPYNEKEGWNLVPKYTIGADNKVNRKRNRSAKSEKVNTNVNTKVNANA